MDIRLPHFQGREDFFSFVRFLDNRKEFDRYIKVLDTKIAEFMKAIALYGKAKDIERKHEEAELWAQRAEGNCAEREQKLKDDEAAFKQAQVDQSKAHADTVAVMQARHNEKGKVLRDREIAVQEREKVIGERETVADKTEQAAQKKHDAAMAGKQAAEAQVKRIKEAVAV